MGVALTCWHPGKHRARRPSVQHLTPGVFAHVGFCGRDTGDTSSNPIRTLLGITCPGCTRVVKKIRRRMDAEKETSGLPPSGQD